MLTPRTVCQTSVNPALTRRSQPTYSPSVDQSRPFWQHEAVVAWLILLLVAWYILRSHSDLHWLILSGIAVVTLFAIWRWTPWRKRFKRPWIGFVILVWVLDLFTARPVPAEGSKALWYGSHAGFQPLLVTELAVDSRPHPFHSPT